MCIQHRSTLIYKANAIIHKREVDNNTIIVGDFLTPHLQQWTDHQDKISKETQALND